MLTIAEQVSQVFKIETWGTRAPERFLQIILGSWRSMDVDHQ
jgi:hypothetical protein